ncbi:MAG: CAP domain-containing protein, partial [Myxococcota bacterium]|nr:CAP domain-containing protein [Myxococcota bacterium]
VDARIADVDATTPTVDSGTSAACAGGALDAPLPDCRPARLPSTGDPIQDCVDRINQFRWECQCLPPLARWSDGEACAAMHAEYDSTRTPHSGFRDGICSPGGNGQNECPGYASVDQTIGLCLQQMWDEGPGEPFSEHGHYINMTNPSFGRVACGFHETASGQVWAIQNFAP